MDPVIQRIADGLVKAIAAEREGQHFYRMAAAATEDRQGKQTFQELAAAELQHEEFLKAQYDAIVRTGKPDPGVKLASPRQFTHPFFSRDLLKRAASAHYEMTALSIGIQLEMSAIGFYQAEAQAAEDLTIRGFYGTLVLWEQGHLGALQRQAEELKEEYWGASGFSPM
jgi:rubrerythrin